MVRVRRSPFPDPAPRPVNVKLAIRRTRFLPPPVFLTGARAPL